MTGGRALTVAAVVAALGAAAYLLPIADWTVPLAERRPPHRRGARGRVFRSVYGMASTVALLPGSILTLGAGFAYGPLWGLAIASPAVSRERPPRSWSVARSCTTGRTAK